MLQDQLTEAGFNGSALKPLVEVDSGPIYRLSQQGGDPAIAAWRKLRSLVDTTGYWPVLLGTPKEVGYREGLEEVSPKLVQETLDYAKTLDGRTWFAKRQQERLAEFEEFNEGEDSANAFAKEGDWPRNAAPSHHFFTPFDVLKKTPLPEVVFALVPTRLSWEVPAYLQLGNWNDCPEAAIHCAVMRYWNEAYGAEMVAATNDIIECSVGRPPTTREGALALAREQYIYCYDIVEQGVGTIAALAAGLLDGSAWYFWWD